MLLTLCGALLCCGPVSAASAGTVEGTVRPVLWAQEVEVCVAESPPGERCVVPEADGSYAFIGLEKEMKFEFVPTYRSGMLTQFYNHKSTLAEADWVGVPREGVVTEIDADLVEGGVIEGTVTAEGGGQSLPEVEVCAVSLSGASFKSCGESDTDGEYELHSLPPGAYKVGFRGHGASAEYQPSSAPSTSVVAAERREINAALAKGAQIAGLLTASAGGGRLADIAVCLFAATATGPERCTYSSEDGSYRFQGLPSGSYQVGFSLSPGELGSETVAGEEDGFQTQYYAGVATRAAAQVLSLAAPGSISGVDASLAAVSVPPPPLPAPIVLAPISEAAAFVAEPPLKRGCKKGWRKKKVKGKARCVKATRHRPRGHRKQKPPPR